MMISNGLIKDESLVVGAVVDCQWHYEINRSGNNVIYIDEITDIISPRKNVSYKSFAQSGEKVILEDDFANELNGGIKLRYRRCYIELIKAIREHLEKQGMRMVSTPILCKNRGTSVVNPARVTGEYLGNKYIKISHELELKKLSFSLLTPVFEFGYVVRDRYITQTGRNEFFTLEAVVPKGTTFNLTEFYIFVIEKAKQIATDLQLQYNADFDHVEYIDLKKEFENKGITFSKEAFIKFCEEEGEKYMNVILMNSPLDSPLGWQDACGVAFETKWNYNGHGMGHGYFDEYRVDVLMEELIQQREYLSKRGIDADLPEDYMRYCEYAAIPTFSFNLGIERFWKNFLV